MRYLSLKLCASSSLGDVGAGHGPRISVLRLSTCRLLSPKERNCLASVSLIDGEMEEARGDGRTGGMEEETLRDLWRAIE